MTWGPFIAGIVMGFAFAGCIAVLLLKRKPRRDPLTWTDEHYRQQPPVTTKITVNRIREFDI
jgi:hypothetical protein